MVKRLVIPLLLLISPSAAFADGYGVRPFFSASPLVKGDAVLGEKALAGSVGVRFGPVFALEGNINRQEDRECLDGGVCLQSSFWVYSGGIRIIAPASRFLDVYVGASYGQYVYNGQLNIGKTLAQKVKDDGDALIYRFGVSGRPFASSGFGLNVGFEVTYNTYKGDAEKNDGFSSSLFIGYGF